MRAVDRLPGAVVIVAALLVVLFGFLEWQTITLAGASPSTLTGWGTIGGADAAVGENINSVISELQGSGSYRPALLATALAALALPAGGRLLLARSKIAAAAAAAVGLFIAVWGVFRALVPGDVAGIVTADDTSRAGVAPWLVGVAGLVMIVAAALVLRDPPPPAPPTRTRGIQHKR